MLYLGMLGAYLGAMATQDAVLLDDLRVMVLDVDGLHRAFA